MSEPQPKKHSVEWTIEDMIATYPSLFQSRTQALHHLFIVLGCGYRWKKGKLVDVTNDKAPDRIPRDVARRLAQYRPKLDRKPYPWTDHCNLARLPADADEDWKAAAEEARQFQPPAQEAEQSTR